MNKKIGRPTKNEKKRVSFTFCIDPELLYQLKAVVLKQRLKIKNYSVSDFINESLDDKLKGTKSG